jgi:tripartite-type tricarboxylate transporter receptor subunit TctC
MKILRRQFLYLVAGATGLSAVSSIARAHPYPTRPVRLIIGIAPGSAPDIFGRLMAQWLSERLGQAFIVENRPGGGGNIAIEAVVNAPADGYTLLLTTIQGAVNATLYEKLNYNFIRDITPVAGISREPLALEVNPSFPAKTVLELIAYAKANPGKLTMASAGIGTTPHVAGELFKMTAGVDMVHVPYRGGALHLPISLAGKCRRCLQPLVRQLSPSGPAGFVPWRYPPRPVPMCCPTFRPWLIFWQAMMCG